MLNIAIVDDENTQALFLSKLVNHWAAENNKLVSISTYPSAGSFHFAWCEKRDFDILLLDIQMKDINGIELAKEIRKSDDKLSIIFITGLSDYIEVGYDVSALHYLIKPVKEEKLFFCLDKAGAKIYKEQPSILVNSDGETIRILQQDLIYAEAFAHSVYLQTAKAGYDVKMSISELDNKLDKTLFIRCHRSYIVGIKYIARIGKVDLTLDNEKSIPVSRRLYQTVNQAFINFFKEV